MWFWWVQEPNLNQLVQLERCVIAAVYRTDARQT
jgi:hypothetical protein